MKKQTLFKAGNLHAGKLLFATALLLSANSSMYAQSCDANSYNMPNTSALGCTGFFYDSGGPSSNYGNNQNLLMNITPTDATSITMTFSAFNTENSYDKLYVYDDINGVSLIATITGTPTVPFSVTSTTGKMSLKFVSDGSVVSSGWSAIWTSYGGSCGFTYNMPNVSAIKARGTVYDSGGPSTNYGNNETKSIDIVPTDATFVCLRFSAFNTEAGYDKLYVSDDVNGGGNQLAGSPFSGTTIPGMLTSNTGKMSLKFVSDGSVVSSGFAAIWSSDGTAREIMTSINENGFATEHISLLPNPTADKVTIGFSLKEAGQTKVVVYNLAGMETLVTDKMMSAGTQTIDFDMSSLASGMYFCKVLSGNSVLVEKLIKQ